MSSIRFGTLFIAYAHLALGYGPWTLQQSTSASYITAAAVSTATSSAGSSTYCPASNNQVINDESGAQYVVLCNTYLTAETEYTVTNWESAYSPMKCLAACDGFNGCVGATYYAGDRCVLAINSAQAEVSNSTSFTSFVKPGISAAQSPPGERTLPSVSSTRALLFTNVTVPGFMTAQPPLSSSTSARIPLATNPSLYGSTSLQICNATNIHCPACDGKQITDNNGTTYRVFCDQQISGSSFFDVQAWTSATGCLLECDNYIWCQGTTYSDDRNCQLAKHQSTLENAPGYTAFLPLPSQYPPSFPTSLPATGSASSPTGALPWNTTASITTAPTGTSLVYPSSSGQPSCTPTAATCPACDGATVTDNFNQTYDISCASEPICQDVVNAASGQGSQALCLEACDADPVCFAALWNNGTCDLCEGALEGSIFYIAPENYVVFLVQLSAIGDTNQTYSANAEASTSVDPQQLDASVSTSNSDGPVPITAIFSTLPPHSTDASPPTSSAMQANTFIAAPAPSGTQAFGVTTTITDFGTTP
jgi:hypothetical protein